MKILYDHQIFYNQDFGGISRYFFELFNSYINENEFEFDLSIKYSNNIYLKQSDKFKNIIQVKRAYKDPYDDFFKGFNFKGKNKLYNIKQKFSPSQIINDLAENKKQSIEKIKEGNFDIFHPTYYDDYFLDYIGNKPYVVTVYDMIHQIFPEYFLWGGTDKSKDFLNNASKIIAISECTKKDLISIYGVDEKKVEVTYLANSLNPTDKQTDDFVNHLPKKYLLFVGTREAYKNFYFFIQAYAVLLKDFSDLCVICTGKAFESYELNYFDNLKIRDKVFHHYIDDLKLSLLYKNAVAFVFPSMYEGFGIPVLEAFACGCAVINSDAGSLPEVGGDASLYFEPKNIESLILVLKKILSDNDFKIELIQKGFEQVKKFSWQKTSEETKMIYKKVLS